MVTVAPCSGSIVGRGREDSREELMGGVAISVRQQAATACGKLGSVIMLLLVTDGGPYIIQILQTFPI